MQHDFGFLEPLCKDLENKPNFQKSKYSAEIKILSFDNTTNTLELKLYYLENLGSEPEIMLGQSFRFFIYIMGVIMLN